MLVLPAAAAMMLVAPGAALAHEGDEEPLPADTGEGLRPVYETPVGADRIIGTPEAGPGPQHSGDRGGSLQFATMGAVTAAVGLVMWRIIHASRRSTHHRAAEIP